MLHLILTLATLMASVSLGVAVVSVSTYNGTINGAKCTNSQTNYFFGIPYGKPPGHFTAPQLFDSKYGENGTLDRTRTAPSCIQFGNIFIEPGAQSEDCLLLDIYMPVNATNSSALPVKVWLYGDNNSGGGISDPAYLGCNVANDAIMVAINYRLGPLGWLSLPSAKLGGNYGLQDQLLALQWIQDNIHFFGGDAKRVLLFGQASGAIDTYVLSTLPQASALFSFSAPSSGGGSDIPTVEEASVYTSKFVEALNCSTVDGECIRAASADTLKQVFGSQPTTVQSAATLWWNNGFGTDWGPVVDGSIVTAQPNKVGPRMPSILGSNTMEANLFTLPLATPDPNGTTYRQFLATNFGPLAEVVLEKFPLSAFNSTPNPSFAAQSVIITDYIFKCSTYRALVATAANGVDVWTYSFNHTSTCSWYYEVPQNAETLKELGPALMSEIPFIFGNVDHPSAPNGSCTMTDAEKAISAFMEGAWTSMAASGKPTANDAIWPKWSSNSSMGIVIGDTVEAAMVDYSICEFWDKIDAGLFELDANGTAGGNTTTSPSSSHTNSGTRLGAAMGFVSGNVLDMPLLAFCLSIGFVL